MNKIALITIAALAAIVGLSLYVRGPIGNNESLVVIIDTLSLVFCLMAVVLALETVAIYGGTIGRGTRVIVMGVAIMAILQAIKLLDSSKLYSLYTVANIDSKIFNNLLIVLAMAFVSYGFWEMRARHST